MFVSHTSTCCMRIYLTALLFSYMLSLLVPYTGGIFIMSDQKTEDFTILHILKLFFLVENQTQISGTLHSITQNNLVYNLKVLKRIFFLLLSAIELLFFLEFIENFPTAAIILYLI